MMENQQMYHQNQNQSITNGNNRFGMGDSDTQHVIKVYDRDNKQIQSEVIYHQNSGNDEDEERTLMQDESYLEALNGG